jgi:formate/nitrite transporter
MSAKDDKCVSFAHVDETIEGAAKAILYKVAQTPGRLLIAGILAGMLIAIGYVFAYMTASSLFPYRFVFDETQHALVKVHIAELIGNDAASKFAIDSISLCKMIAGAVFPIGLIAILIGGAELWTSGPQLVSYGYVRKKFDLNGLLYNWFTAYAGNWIGAVLVAFIVTFGTGMLLKHPFIDMSLAFATHKVELDPWKAFWAGVGCNWLVNLAVWLWLRAKKGDFAGQVILIWFPIFAFVAIGFEHCIANMFAISAGIFESSLKWNYYAISYREFFFNNILPVTYGNLVGGFVFVALAYWYMGYVKGSEFGEVATSDALKFIVDILVVAGVAHLVAGVVIPGLIASSVEALLGLKAGVMIENAWIALVPAVVTAIYYLALPVIAKKLLKPTVRF